MVNRRTAACTYQNLPPRLFSPGKESAGRVIAVGDAVDRVTVGQRALTLVEYGGYAEKLVVPEDLVMALPDGMSYEEAAACGLVNCSYFVIFITIHSIRASLFKTS